MPVAASLMHAVLILSVAGSSTTTSSKKTFETKMSTISCSQLQKCEYARCATFSEKKKRQNEAASPVKLIY